MQDRLLAGLVFLSRIPNLNMFVTFPNAAGAGLNPFRDWHRSQAIAELPASHVGTHHSATSIPPSRCRHFSCLNPAARSPAP